MDTIAAPAWPTDFPVHELPETQNMIRLTDCQAHDAQDPLRRLRDAFSIPEGVIYLDGNSLGVMPKAAPARIAEVVSHEWGHELIRAWNSADWFGLPRRLGDKIARLIGAGPGEVVATDSTSSPIMSSRVHSSSRETCGSTHSRSICTPCWCTDGPKPSIVPPTVCTLAAPTVIDSISLMVSVCDPPTVIVRPMRRPSRISSICSVASPVMIRSP